MQKRCMIITKEMEMINKTKITFTLRKKLFYNRSGKLICLNCDKDLQEKYVLSNRHQKYRCLPCAVKMSIIDKIPEGIPEDEY